MNITVGRHFEFEACHKLPDDQIYGACRNLHGHRYELDVEIMGDTTKEGWVCDFKELKEIVYSKIISVYDHSYLNNFFEVPTAENMAAHIFNTLNCIFNDKGYRLNKVRLHETRNCYAEVTSG